MINWALAQTRLAAAGFACGVADGRAGPNTYAALFAFAAVRPRDGVINAIGASAAKAFPVYGLDLSAPRLSEIVAQTCNETGGYRLFEENLKYSVKAIRACWPNRFPTDAAAAPFAWDPADADREDMALAARAYGQRMGNLPATLDTDDQEDGWQYRGRGMLQLTGRANYSLFGGLTGLPLIEHPELAADPADSLLIACAFWKRGNVNAAVDRGDFTEARRITNGGAIGLANVATIRNRILEIFA
jgi:putative chitinase